MDQVRKLTKKIQNSTRRKSKPTDEHSYYGYYSESSSSSSHNYTSPTGTLTDGRSPGGAASVGRTFYNGTKVVLEVAKESADALPPLKSALGGVVAFLKLYDVRSRLLIFR